ncbi:MAG TPA: hypothetical protein DD426_11420, partial [Clostridiaceae bacterium]|nr:hypothetical protein [Clostridiaceae bacterium]
RKITLPANIREQKNLSLFSFILKGFPIKGRKTMEAKKDRRPAMDTGSRVISFMNTPPVLHSKAVKNNKMADTRFFLSEFVICIVWPLFL